MYLGKEYGNIETSTLKMRGGNKMSCIITFRDLMTSLKVYFQVSLMINNKMMMANK